MMSSNTSLHKLKSMWILLYSLSRFFWGIIKIQIYKTNKNLVTQKLMNNIFIIDFLLPSNPFKRGQHLASMIQNVVFNNSHRQPAKICPIQINILSNLHKSLQDKLRTTHMTPGPPLHFVQVQICYPCHMRSTLIH
jgi:hypothetical protein